VRGTLAIHRHALDCVRFIPACAGNATLNDSLVPGGSVHPRVCGERQYWRGDKSWQTGSSPRVRGTLRHDLDCTVGDRFIPACAGNAARYSK